MNNEEFCNNIVPRAYQGLAFCQYKLDDEEEASNSIFKSLNFAKTAEDFANIASSFLWIDNLDEAKKYIKKSFEMENENDILWSVKGDYHDELKEFEKALKCYNKALKFDFDGINSCFIKKDIKRIEKILKDKKQEK